MKYYASKKIKGFTLVEAMLAAAILTFLVASAVLLFRMMALNIFQTKDKMILEKLTDMGFSTLSRMPFWEIVDLDSNRGQYIPQASADFTLPAMSLHTATTGNGHPSKKLLDGYKEQVLAEGFDRFTVDVTFFRRDWNNPGNPLVPFEPSASNPLVDANDNEVQFVDRNGDGDFYDVYLSTRPFPYEHEWVSEFPNTHMREARLSLWRNGVVVSSFTKMYNLGALSGERKTSSEALLRLVISTPTKRHVVYQSTSAEQIAARNVTITKSLPASHWPMRADMNHYMYFEGYTNDGATVFAYRQDGTLINQWPTSAGGNFAFNTYTLTNELQEGANTFIFISKMDNFNSANNTRTLVLDMVPPALDTKKPAGAATVKTRTPYVGALLRDLPFDSSKEASGIDAQTIALEYSTDGGLNWSEAYHRYDYDTDRVFWVYTDTEPTTIPPTLPDDPSITYTMRLSAADKAGFKVTDTWTFNVDLEEGDTSIPKGTPNTCVAINSRQVQMHIEDTQTGINPSTLEMYITRHSPPYSTNITYFRPTIFSDGGYDPETGIVTGTYITNPSPARQLYPGYEHTVYLIGADWAGNQTPYATHGPCGTPVLVPLY